MLNMLKFATDLTTDFGADSDLLAVANEDVVYIINRESKEVFARLERDEGDWLNIMFSQHCSPQLAATLSLLASNYATTIAVDHEHEFSATLTEAERDLQ